VPLVYKQSGSRVVKQEIVTGAMNDDEVIVEQGLDESDKVLLSIPHDKDKMTLTRLPGSTAGKVTAGGDTAVAPKATLPAAPDSAKPPAVPAKPKKS
jgi:hypothetical protein